ncbi:MAG: hypothetical protein PUF12_00810 [Thermoflexaceae bacterium]|nr:hypothetical protein [Thermoflexaceae bacterium]
MYLVMDIIDVKTKKNHPYSLWFKVSIPGYSPNNRYQFVFTGTEIKDENFALTDIAKDNLILMLQETFHHGPYNEQDIKKIYMKNKRIKVKGD